MSTSKRLMIVGDSHVAALQYAISRHSWPVQFGFFAHNSLVDANLGHLECAADCLEMNAVSATTKLSSSTQSNRFRPDDYDAIVLVGLRTELPYALWNACDCGTTYISQAVHRAAMVDYIEQQALSLNIARKIRCVSDCPVIVIPNPYLDMALRGRAIHTAPGIVPRGLVAADKITDEAAKLETWKSIFLEAFRPHNVSVLFQPISTTIDHVFTKSEYTIGHSTPPEMRHTNWKFGQIVMQNILNTLGVEKNATADPREAATGRATAPSAATQPQPEAVTAPPPPAAAVGAQARR